MIFILLVYGFLMGLKTSGVMATDEHQDFNITTQLARQLKIYSGRNTRLFNPFQETARGRFLRFSFNISAQDLTSLDRLTFYYRVEELVTSRSFNQSVNSTSFHWLYLQVKCNDLLAYRGGERARKIYNDWWKIKIPKKHLQNTISSNIASHMNVLFEMKLKFPRRRLPKYLNQSILYIEKTTPSEDNPPEVHTRCMGSCCLQPLIIDLDTLPNWDWVLFPRKYTANYCAGSCQPAYMSPREVSRLSPQSRLTQQVLNQISEPKSAISCVADTTEPVRILYKDFWGSIRSSNSSFYTVTSCKCV